MPTPIICADPRLRQFAVSFHACFSKPQAQYFVTVLLALLLCLEPATGSALQRAVCFGRSLAGLSRFLAQAPWSVAAVASTWPARFRCQLTPLGAAEVARQQAARPRRPGRPPVTLVTGYLIGDDSVCAKPRVAQPRRRPSPAPPQPMAALSQHYSSTAGTTVQGHDVVLTQYVLLGRNYPQQPALYRQTAVCAAEHVSFQSKIDLMAAQIRRFVPAPGSCADNHEVVLLRCAHSYPFPLVKPYRAGSIPSGRFPPPYPAIQMSQGRQILPGSGAVDNYLLLC